ncbi:MAG TPA: hypothetical protein PK395_16960 [bacterium]|nr:hypothetical protein [bacterium]HQP98104.1 hypothetical protein [bacterium]
MSILVIRPSHPSSHFAYFTGGYCEPILTGDMKSLRSFESNESETAEELRRIRSLCRRWWATSPRDALAVRLTFTASEFSKPVVVCPDVLRQLQTLVPRAPLHLPPKLRLIEHCREAFPKVPIVVVSETSFFSDLPSRERYYGLHADITKDLQLERYGFHGIFHESACYRARHQLGREGVPRILSICLLPRPEIAAVMGTRPVMVTGGVTPLEGIPGETTCGELDAGIVLSLRKEMGWGPEQINTVLTRESGLLGVVGKTATLDTIFRSNDPEVRLAREMIQYRILLACGAGIAAMGGVDAIVFSGDYVDVGEILGPWLSSKLVLKGERGQVVPWMCFRESLDRLIADSAELTVGSMREFRTSPTARSRADVPAYLCAQAANVSPETGRIYDGSIS